ncbi:putative manganese efflux pump MntP {ECO:0000255/HAMAP-Rule:MF_01521} [Petrimonas mucosa]|jgi:putative Mn2+ efflux pump MntP|uniref:Putative manganese efflux pump MntP n=2 Tax=Petrimonas mucosa TaxID=1642646 RepID=A0A1G4G5Y1_9BACT|nr:putative manganese efflux pump MntP {ECO:0000255/HAMAP-Rule:MF_01521} [Petrimonas mucosa]
MLIAIGLAMDSFAVCIGKGMCRRHFYPWRSARIALVFGLFQGLMPFAGYALGISFATWIQDYDHWVAFFILFVIGVKMISEGFVAGSGEECLGCDCQEDMTINWRKVVVLAFATSIDAMAIGLVFVSYPGTIMRATVTIALVTLLFAFSGMFIGVRFGRRFRFNVEILGGFILMAIGTKILLEHLVAG